MAIVHISEAAAARDFAGLMARVRAGEEVIIDSDDSSAESIRLSSEPPRRSNAETIARIRAHAKERGYMSSMDPDYAEDLEEIIRNRKPRDTAWD